MRVVSILYICNVYGTCKKRIPVSASALPFLHQYIASRVPYGGYAHVFALAVCIYRIVFFGEERGVCLPPVLILLPRALFAHETAANTPRPYAITTALKRWIR